MHFSYYFLLILLFCIFSIWPQIESIHNLQSEILMLRLYTYKKSALIQIYAILCVRYNNNKHCITIFPQ